MKSFKIIALLLLGMLINHSLRAQYSTFGRNKANYEEFDFKVFQSPNFEIYHYLKNEDYLREFADYSERWYKMHQQVLMDTIAFKNPLILYNDHADFQQTTAISGQIGVGTGGVTEGLKNRVVMPIAMSNQQTIHVLGHELVHAFQYDMVIRGDSTSMNDLSNLPLWMIEGLAEYLSIGGVDSHTAMWMRDAVMRDDVPSLKDLRNPKYFPYRYGQAFWAFLTGMQGDDVIQPFFIATARLGLDGACMLVLGMSQENLSELWQQSIKKHFGQFLTGEKENFIGRKLISEENAGRLNISPSISPNGRYVIFLSEKDLFTIDLFLADANSGEIIRKVASTLRDGHIDDFNYIESAGTWSPRSDQFAFVGISKGQNILIIKDVNSGKSVKEVKLDGVPAFTNPTWSPNGNTIVVTGLVEGQVDLFAYNVRTDRVERLTNDRYSESLPSWSEDGNRLIFSTDEVAMHTGRTDGRLAFNLAVMDLVSGQKEMINVFPGADNMNPLFDSEGNIYFLSNRDGFRNAYKVEAATGQIYQLTDYQTGITGITQYAPAMSIDRRRDYVVYSYFFNNGYTIYRARQDDFLRKEVSPDDVNFAAATLPRVNKRADMIVDDQLQNIGAMPTLPDAAFADVKYKPNFKLDYVSSGGIGAGVGTSNIFGTTTGLAGSVMAGFSDILGNHNLYGVAAVNGEIYDAGGIIGYMNQKHRFLYGASLSHIPIPRFLGRQGGFTDLDIGNNQSLPVFEDAYIIERIFQEQLGVFAAYPFSSTLRLEGSVSYAFYNFRRDKISNYYEYIVDPGSGQVFFGRQIGQDRNRIPGPEGFNMGTVGTALVGDNSYFGITAPLTGYRYRIGVDQYFGDLQFLAPTIDLRGYKRLEPVTLAARAYHHGRYGGNSDEIFPLFIGAPWFVRGFNTRNLTGYELRFDNDSGKYYVEEENIQTYLQDRENAVAFENLIGSKMLMGNFEVRIPFTGPERLSVLKSKFLFSDLNFFFDAGVAWYDNDQFNKYVPELGADGQPIPIYVLKGTDDLFTTLVDPVTEQPIYYSNKPRIQPLMSIGASLRVNLFGQIILEPFYAIPLSKGVNSSFGLNILPGW